MYNNIIVFPLLSQLPPLCNPSSLLLPAPPPPPKPAIPSLLIPQQHIFKTSQLKKNMILLYIVQQHNHIFVVISISPSLQPFLPLPIALLPPPKPTNQNTLTPQQHKFKAPHPQTHKPLNKTNSKIQKWWIVAVRCTDDMMVEGVTCAEPLMFISRVKMV